jgi:nucleotide-binding universal stress UspA family protein
MGPRVRDCCSTPQPVRSIVIGTDGSPSAEAAVRRGAEVARGSGARVQLVTAYPDIPSYKETIRSSAKAEAIDLREVAEGVLARAARELEAEGVEVDTHAREGDPAHVIIEAAEETGRRADRRWVKGTHRARAVPARKRVEQARPARSHQPHGRAGRLAPLNGGTPHGSA